MATDPTIRDEVIATVRRFVARSFRDAPLMIIGAGTNEIQRIVIARGLLARARERSGEART